MTEPARTIRLAHLTDVHLGPVTGFWPHHWNLKRTLGFANWHSKRKAVHRPEALAAIVDDLASQHVTHIAVTGDLVNIGLPEEYAAAGRWLAALGSPETVSVIPGNHDIYTRLRRDPGVGRWQAYMTGDQAGAGLIAAAHLSPPPAFPYVRCIGAVALVGLNSAVPTPVGVAAGELGRRQLDALSALLPVLAERGLARVIMIHHPPLPGQGARLRGLRDADALAEVLHAHGAELVIHGHNHIDMLAETVWQHPDGARTVPVVGAASASAARAHHHEPLARYNIYTITPQSGGWTMIRTIRGLAEPAGRVVEIQSGVLPTVD